MYITNSLYSQAGHQSNSMQLETQQIFRNHIFSQEPFRQSGTLKIARSLIDSYEPYSQLPELYRQPESQQIARNPLEGQAPWKQSEHPIDDQEPYRKPGTTTKARYPINTLRNCKSYIYPWYQNSLQNLYSRVESHSLV